MRHSFLQNRNLLYVLYGLAAAEVSEVMGLVEQNTPFSPDLPGRISFLGWVLRRPLKVGG